MPGKTNRLMLHCFHFPVSEATFSGIVPCIFHISGAQQTSPFCVVTKAPWSAIVVNRSTPAVCFFHFLFVTVVKAFLAISAAVGEGKINTLNVMSGRGIGA